MLFKRGFTRIAGVDEVGRGPLAGPVVAACVILPQSCNPALYCDSKTTTKKRRYELKDMLLAANAPMGIGIVSPKIIDRINILQASLLAMKQSVHELSQKTAPPDYILVDGTFEIPFNFSQQTLTRGDSRSASIGAASIIAKITRDEIMEELDRSYPLYGFKNNKGYPTHQHRAAIKQYGPCPEHRFTFKGVKEGVTK